MSEIYSPGSIAGPQGPAGPAGSQGSVTALASATLPSLAGANLFDATKMVANYNVNPADGTLVANTDFHSSALIFCPGATSMIANIPINLGWAGFALYDANGNFISSLPSTAFGSVYQSGPQSLAANRAFPLPGNQVYVRFSWLEQWNTGAGYAASAATAMVSAAMGTATLPGSYVPCGLDTVAGVNAKIASAVNTRAAIVDAAINDLGAFVLPLNANRFDPSTVQVGYQTNLDGTVAASTLANGPAASGMIYCPGATALRANFVICQDNLNNWTGNPGVGCAIQLYDSLGQFQGTAPYPQGSAGAPFDTNIALPGTQTFIRFTMQTAGGSYQGLLPACGMVFTGSLAKIAPMDLNTRFFPFSAVPLINQFARGTTKKASELGAGLTCDFNNPGINPGNGLTAANIHATDDTAVLNAFLATASPLNPVKLILDGAAYTTGLVISPNGYTTIEGTGWGSGIYLMDNCNQDAIRIGAYTPATEGTFNVAAPAQAATNIILRDFVIHGNGEGVAGSFGVTAVNQPVAGAPAHAVYGITLANCTNVHVDNVSFHDCAWFALLLSNVSFATVSNCQFISTGTTHDGVHMNGLCSDISIANSYFATGDDAIALNAPEGYGGDISRVTVTNCTFNGSLTVMRAYTSLDPAAMATNNTHKIRNVVVSNCTGNTRDECFNIGITNGGLSATFDADQLQDFSVSNCTLSSPLGLALLLTPIGSITFKGVKFIPASASPLVCVWYPVGELTLDDVTVLRNPDGNSAPAGLVTNSGISNIDKLSLLNCRVVDELGSAYAALPYVLDIQGTVTALRMEGMDLSHITALASAAGWAGVTKLLGGGVMGTGAQVPDSVMGDNALYLSSDSSGAPSIKLGGVAKRLALA